MVGRNEPDKPTPTTTEWAEGRKDQRPLDETTRRLGSAYKEQCGAIKGNPFGFIETDSLTESRTLAFWI